MSRALWTAISGFALLTLIAVASPSAVSAQSSALAQNSATSAARSASSSSKPASVTPGTSKRGGITISPAFQQITLKPDQSSLTFDFSVTNNSAQEYEFGLSVVDFGSLDETGGVLFVGNGEKALSYRYALSPWVTLEKDRIVVGPHATQKVPITLINKESLTPGGHYGAVLVTPTENGDVNAKKVQIDQVASSLLFVKKQGGEVYKLDLNRFKTHPRIFSLPGTADMRFQNAGNVHVIPRGLVTLSDPHGVVVKRGVINADSGIVLPESFRSLSIPLQTIGSSLQPGRYKLTASYRYDDQTNVRVVETSFFYVSAWLVVLAAGVIALVVAPIVSRRLRHAVIVTSKRAVCLVKRLFDQVNRLVFRRKTR